MKILNVEQIRAADQYTIQNEPILSINLMERAAKACCSWFLENIANNRPVKIFVGPGNNGGDGWALARLLAEKDYEVRVYLLNISKKLSKDAERNRDLLAEQGKVPFRNISDKKDIPIIGRNDVVVDALFGSGLSRRPEGLAGDLIKHLNAFSNLCIAVDIPSGLFGEQNEFKGDDKERIIHADYTLSFQFPKLSFLFAENNRFVGEWIVLPIGLHHEFISSVKTPYIFLDEGVIDNYYQKRSKYAHKGNFGHALLIAGSYGMMGAAVLSTRAALKSGVGLITTHVPRKGYQVLQTTVPEAMLSLDESDILFTSEPEAGEYSAVGIGPGIGQKPNTLKGLQKLLETINSPMLLDADALNLISENPNLLSLIPENSILTPHPKEFERLFGKSASCHEQLVKQMDMSKKHKIIIVLKGAHTSISLPDGKVFFNSTGNPGMATAGSGDVLSGIILSLLSQKYPPKSAALLGVYLHGLSGDIAKEEMGEEALTASDIINNLGKAFKHIALKNTL